MLNFVHVIWLSIVAFLSWYVTGSTISNECHAFGKASINGKTFECRPEQARQPVKMAKG